jgi:hypothetical protein
MHDAKALSEFQRSIGRLVIAWPWRGPEPTLHRKWRLLASVVRRFELYNNAGLDEHPGMAALLFDVECRERVARFKWLSEKQCREMRYSTGRTKTPPPWDF